MSPASLSRRQSPCPSILCRLLAALLLLLLLAACPALGVDPGGGVCTPCPAVCRCARVSPNNTCMVDCAGQGLADVPPLESLPTADSITHMNLSGNHLNTITQHYLRQFAQLNSLYLGGNPFACDCRLAWLQVWLSSNQNTIVQDLDKIKCATPSSLSGQLVSNAVRSLLSCGPPDFISCYMDNYTGESIPVMYDTLQTIKHEQTCNIDCFARGYQYYLYRSPKFCLCSSGSRDISGCVCPDLRHVSEPMDAEILCDKVYLRRVLKATVRLRVSETRPYNVGELVELQATTDQRMSTYTWDFNDGAIIQTTKNRADHRYSYPGVYEVHLSTALEEGVENCTVSLLVQRTPRVQAVTGLQYGSVAQRIPVNVTLISGSDISIAWRIINETGQIITDPECAYGGSRAGDMCIMKSSEPARWDEGQNRCRQMGGNLVMIDSSETNQLVSSLLQDSTDQVHWIGLSDRIQSGRFIWTTGYSLSSFQQWAPSQPDSSMPPEDCVAMMHSNQQWLWHDNACGLRYGYICQYPVSGESYTVQSYLAGAALFPSKATTSQELMPASSINPPANGYTTSIIIMPEARIEQEGVLTEWVFQLDQLDNPASFQLLVFRPECSGGYVLYPGCDVNSKTYTMCHQDLSCPVQSLPQCDAGEGYCSLSQVCQSQLVPCLCTHPAMNSSVCSSGARSIQTSLTRFQISRSTATYPQYRTVHAANLAVEAVSSAMFTVPVDLSVKPGDILGFQYLTQQPDGSIPCDTNTESEWRQTVLQATRSDWLTANDVLQVGPANLLHDKLCLLRASYAKPLVVLAPEALTPGPAVMPGPAVVQATINDNPALPVYNHSLTLLHPTDNATLVLPTAISQTNGMTAVVVQAGTSQAFVLHLPHGHQATAQWTIDQQEVTFTENCQNATGGLMTHLGTCAVFYHTFDNSHLERQINITISNMVSSTTLHIIAKIQEIIQGAEILQNTNRSLTVGDTEAFRVVAATGTHLRYLWTVNGIFYDDTDSNVLNYTFTQVGTYTFEVDLYNDINTENTSLVVITGERAVIHINSLAHPQYVATNADIWFHLIVTYQDKASLNYQWDFGDGSTQQGLQLETIKHVYQISGHYNVMVWVSHNSNDAFMEAEVNVQDAVRGVSIQTNSPLGMVRGGTVEGLIRPTAIEGTNITMVVRFNGEEVNTKNSTAIQRRYSQTGYFPVHLTVLNEVSEENASSVITVQEIISAASVMINGSSSTVLMTGSTYRIDTSTPDGTNIRYSYHLEGIEVCTNQVCPVVISAPGNYSLNIIVYNLVSNVSVVSTLQVYTPIIAGDVTCNATVATVNSTVLFSLPLIQGSSAYYQWKMCDICESFVTYSSEMLYSYGQTGTFIVEATAVNPVSSQHRNISIVVVEMVKELDIHVINLVKDGYAALDTELEFWAISIGGSVFRYLWSIRNSDGQTVAGGEGLSFRYLADATGDYTVFLQAESMGGINEISRTFQVVQPVGNLVITANTTVGIPGEIIHIEVNSSTDANISLEWEITHNGKVRIPVASMVQSLIRTFKSVGLYEVKVQAENEISRSYARLEVVIEELIRGPRVEISDPNAPYVSLNKAITFTFLTDTGTGILYSWMVENTPLADNLASNSIQYIFSRLGWHTVLANATNAVSFRSIRTAVYVEEELAGMQLSSSCVDCVEGGMVNFTVRTQAGSDLSYQFNFGDGVQIVTEEKMVSYTYQGLGMYSVDIAAWNNVSSATVTGVVNIIQPIAGLYLVGCCTQVYVPYDIVTFEADVSSGTQVTFNWTIYDSSIPTHKEGARIHHQFRYSGQHHVALAAINPVGQEKRDYIVHVQEPISVLSITPNTDTGMIFTGVPVTFTANSATGSDIVYEWTVQGYTAVPGSQTYTAIFNTTGAFTVSAIASNNVSTETAHLNFEVKKVECHVPSLSAIGGTTREELRSRTVVVEVLINLHGCTVYEVLHSWVIYEGTDCSSQAVNATQRNMTSNTPFLHIKPRFLQYGNHCILFTTQYKNTPVRTQILIDLKIKPSSLQPIISGGSSRIHSLIHRLVLDGSLSYDPDVNQGEPSGLTYLWTCTSQAVPENGRKDGSSGSEDDNCFNELHGAIVAVPANSLIPDRTYTFQLLVSKQGHENETTQQNVTITSEGVLVPSIECVSCSATNVYTISKSQHVKLRGICNNCIDNEQENYRWTATRDDGVKLLLNHFTTTTGFNHTNLSIRRGALSDGHAYTFELQIRSAYFPMDGKASLKLNPSHPPSGGGCNISPTVATSLEMPVTVECWDWRNQDGDSRSLLVYHVFVQKDAAELGTADWFSVYKGPNSNNTFHLSPWADKINDTNVVFVFVAIVGSTGSHTIGLNRSIELMPMNVSAGETNSQHLLYLTMTNIPLLCRQNNPRSLLQYTIALLMQLNIEAGRTKEDQFDAQTEKRARMAVRDLVTAAVAESCIPIVQLGDLHQIAFVLSLLTEYSSEFQNTTSWGLLTNLLKEMVLGLQPYISQGLVANDFSPGHMFSTAGNLIRAVNYRVYHPQHNNVTSDPPEITHPPVIDIMSRFPEGIRKDIVETVLNIASGIMSNTLQTHLPNEAPVVLDGTNIHISGKRTLGYTVGGTMAAIGCSIKVPEGFLGYIGREEVFQVSMVTELNPYTWGFHDKREVSTKVAGLLYQFPNSTSINIRGLPDARRVQILMSSVDKSKADTWHKMWQSAEIYMVNSKNFNSTDSDEDIPTYTKGMAYTPIEISPGKAKKARLNTAVGFTKAALHIQVVGQVIPAWNETFDDVDEQLNLTAYLGFGFTPTADKYNQTLNIDHKMIEMGDHRGFTFFINGDFVTGSCHDITIVNHLTAHSVNVSVGMYFTSCQFYNDTGGAWDTAGCTPQPESLPTETVCLCNHLTSFGGSVLVPPESIKFEDLGSLDLYRNPVVLIVVLLIGVVYLILLPLARRWDRKDLHRVGIVPLCGKDGTYHYEVTVVTGMKAGAGTTANVGLRLYGEMDRSESFHLSKVAAFQRNQQDSFLVATDTYLGDLWKIQVWHDNSGSDPSWFLSRVIVRDLHSGRKTIHLVNAWLDLTLENGVIEKQVIAAGPEDIQQFSGLFKLEMTRGFADRHMWLSVLERPAHKSFTRVQRLTCCITCVYAFTCANAMWYGLLKTREGVEQEPLFYFSWEDVVTGIAAGAMVFPLGLIIMQLFRKSRNNRNPFKSLARPVSSLTVEMDIQCEQTDLHKSFRVGPSEPSIGSFGMDRESTVSSIKTAHPLHRTGNIKTRRPSKDSLRLDITKGDKEGSMAGENWWSFDRILTWPEGNSHSGAQSSSKPKPKEQDQAAGSKERERPSYYKFPKLHKPSKHRMFAEKEHAEDTAGNSCDSAFYSEGKEEETIGMTQINSKKTLCEEIDEEIGVQDTSFCQDNSKQKKKTGPRRSSVQHGTHPSDSSDTYSLSLSSVGSNAFLSSSNHFSSTKRYLLPHWCVHLTYFFCFLLSVLCIVVTLLYGHQFGRDVSIRWLLALLTSLLQSMLILEPLKVLMVAALVAAFTRTVDISEDDKTDGMPLLEANEKIKKDVKLRPIGGFALLQAKEEGHRVRRMRQMFRQTLVYFILTLLIMVTAYMNHHHTLYITNANIKDIYTGQPHMDNFTKGFTDIQRTDDFWQWLEEDLSHKLFNYHTRPESTHPYLLGQAQLRQIRSTTESCPAQRALLAMSTEYLLHHGCYVTADVREDTSTYQQCWDNKCSYNTSWVYQTASQLHGRGTHGQVGWYNGGGYVVSMGHSTTQLLNTIQYLKNTTWIDRGTRAVFTEFSLYSPVTNHYSWVSLLVEFPLSGGALPSSFINTYQVFRFQPGRVQAVLVCMCLLGVILLYFLLKVLSNIIKQGRSYFKDIWNWLELSMSICAIATITLFGITVTEGSSTLQHHLGARQDFTSFVWAEHYYTSWKYLNAVLVFIVFIIICRQMRFIKWLSIYGRTLHKASGSLCGIALIFSIILTMFSHLGYLWYGSMIATFRSFGVSLLSLSAIFHGQSVYFDSLLTVNYSFTVIYFLAFMWVSFLVIAGLIIATLNYSYKWARKDMYYHNTLEPQDYEMVEFMLKRFKKWAGITKPKPAFRRVKFQGLNSLSSASTRSRRSSVSQQQLGDSFDSTSLEEQSAAYTAELITRCLPTWELMLIKLREVEELDREEKCLDDELHKRLAQRAFERAKAKSKPESSKIKQDKFWGLPPKPPPRTKRLSETRISSGTKDRPSYSNPNIKMSLKERPSSDTAITGDRSPLRDEARLMRNVNIDMIPHERRKRLRKMTSTRSMDPDVKEAW